MTDRKNHQTRFWLLLAALLLAGGTINLWQSTGEARVVRQPLKDFPSRLGAWRQMGRDDRLDADVERVLRADDYLQRNFAAPDGRTASFYVGYYATQRNGATYHSPLNCLPGAGWTMTEAGQITITPSDGGKPFEANRYLVQNGDNRQVLVYWYQGRGRALSSEYWGKIYTVWDSIRRRRSDGAMVRVMLPAGESEPAAFNAAAELAALAAPQLRTFIPD
jgi:EpsI family protein